MASDRFLTDDFPMLATERLVLSKLATADIPQIVRLASNANVSAYTTNLPYPYFERDAIYWLNLAEQGFRQDTNLVLAIRQSSQLLIGGISLTISAAHRRAEIGYWLGEEFWNQGYVTEATRALIAYAFTDMNLHRLTSTHFAGNPASGRVMQKAGMTHEGELQDQLLKDAVYHSLIQYGVINPSDTSEQ